MQNIFKYAHSPSPAVRAAQMAEGYNPRPSG